MSTLRPVVSVYNAADATPMKTVVAAGVFCAPLRPDIVNFVVDQLQKNRRQPYAVSKNAGYQTAAESWGTGRAVARIPRVPGGGTHRAGQAAFGNQCRGGGMFNPTKIWRKWHRKVNIKAKRQAMATAIAATGVPALVMARGHRIEEVPELPLVVSNDIQSYVKTKEAKLFLRRVGLGADIDKVTDNKQMRPGKGKMRNRRWIWRKGPLIVYGEDEGIMRAFRNIPGVDLLNVESLNVLKLAPGGHMGRAVVWTESAMEKLKPLYGDQHHKSTVKKNFMLQRNCMANADLARIINSDEIQSVLRPMKEGQPKRRKKKNPLKNKDQMELLNPGSRARAKIRQLERTPGHYFHKVAQAKKEKLKAAKKAHKKKSKAWFKSQMDAYKPQKKEAAAEADE